MKYLTSMPVIFMLVLCMCVALIFSKIIGAKNLRQKLQISTYRATLKIWRIKLTLKGELAPAPALLVANHCSYLDVPILGSLGAMRFTPKIDVKRWVLIGRVVQAFDVIFVDRNASRAANVQTQLQNAMLQGGRLCIFPEGTTNNGQQLKPFKSAMFSLAIVDNNAPKINLQPVAIRYLSVDGKPIEAQLWQKIAWFGDSALMPHMWGLGRFKCIEVEVNCLPMIEVEGKNRKELASQAEDVIQQTVFCVNE